MSDRKALVRAYLQARHTASWPVIQGVEQQHYQLWVYPEENPPWNVRDVIAHLADAERGLLLQLKRLSAGEPTLPDNFDLQRWNRGTARRSAEVSLDELVRQIEASYEDVLSFLEEVSEDQLDLTGRHGSGEWLSGEAYFRRIADHRAEHAADIERALKR